MTGAKELDDGCEKAEADEPRGSKLARVTAVSPVFEAASVFLPDPAIAPGVHDYYGEELGTVPAALTRIRLMRLRRPWIGSCFAEGSRCKFTPSQYSVFRG